MDALISLFGKMEEHEKNGAIAAQNRLEFVSGLNDVQSVLEDSKNFFEHKCSQILIYDTIGRKAEIIVNNGYPDEFYEYLIKSGDYRIDPVFGLMCTSERLKHWRSVEAGYFKTDATLRLKLKAESYGIVDGFTYTIEFGKYLIMLSFVNDDYFIEVDRLKLALFSYCHNYINVVRKYLSETIQKLYGIGDEEIKAFKLYTRRYDYSVVARELGGKARNTVRNQIQDVRIKLGAKTLDEALCIAFREGLID